MEQTYDNSKTKTLDRDKFTTNQIKWLVTHVILLLILVISLIIYQKARPKNRPLPKPELTVSSSFDLTKDWQIYTNQDIGISFKTPIDFTVKSDQNSIKITSPLFTCREKGSTKDQTYMSEITINISKHTGTDFSQVWQQIFNFPFNKDSFDGSELIDNKQAYYFFQGAEMSFGRKAELLKLTPSSFLELNIYTPSYEFECQTNNLDLYVGSDKKIISTFKFNDQSSTITKWQGYDYLGNAVFITENWHQFQSKKGGIHYIFNIPSDWEKVGGVFLDAQGNKIAELSPGGVELKPGQSCFDNYKLSETDENTKILSQNVFNTKYYTSTKQILETQYEGGKVGESYTGKWYPNVYCLQKDNKAFVITFYERDLNFETQSMFDEILATFAFVN